MLDFRSKRSTVPNYQSRGEQYRLLGLVMGLGFVFWLITTVANPDNWAWIWRLNHQAEAPKGPAVDTRLAHPEQTSHEPSPIMHAPAATGTTKVDVERKLFPGITPELLANVQDDRAITSRDNVPFYTILKILKDADPHALAAYSRGVVPFIQIFKQPELYRGEVITVRGYVKRALASKVQPNDFGIEKNNQLWIKPDDRDDPIVAYCLDLPLGFPTGDELNERIELTGVFYKRWAYFWRNQELHSTPLVLAKSFTWTPVSKPAQAQTNYTKIAINVGAGVLMVLILVIVLVRRSRGSTHPYLAKVSSRTRGPMYEGLKDLEVSPEVRQALREATSESPAKPPEPSGELPAAPNGS